MDVLPYGYSFHAEARFPASEICSDHSDLFLHFICLDTGTTNEICMQNLVYYFKIQD